MCLTRRLFALFCFVLVVMFACPFVNASEDDEDYYKQRVARVNLLGGDVQLRHKDSRDWERVVLNLPLSEGDQIATGNDSKIEIQLDAYNFIHLAENSLLTIVTLRDEGIAISLTEGTVSVRLSRFDKQKEYFEIDAPKTTIAAEKQGLYRVDAPRGQSRSGEIVLTVRGGGQARVYSDSAGFSVKDGRSAKLFLQNGEINDWDVANISLNDNWDRWIEQREYQLAQRLRYDKQGRYYDENIYGAEDLDNYGDWYYADQYGYIWRPRRSSISIYVNWTPYRHGHWRYVSPFGWTWIPDEPWGWSVYHYGSWVYYNGDWCWTPYTYHRRGRWWQPAHVVFVYVPTSYGQQICWYPRPYYNNSGRRNPRGNPTPTPTPTPIATATPRPSPTPWEPQRDPRLTPTPVPADTRPLVVKGGSDDKKEDPAINAKEPQVPRGIRDLPKDIQTQYIGAISTKPADQFGNMTTKINPSSNDINQNILRNEPVMGNLSVRPNNANNGVKVGRDEQIVRTEPGQTNNANDGRGTRMIPTEVPIGAMPRKPGVPLDNDLRQNNTYKGREPLEPANNTTTKGNSENPVNTGAVSRPVRTPPSDRNGGSGINNTPNEPSKPASRPQNQPGDDGNRTEKPRNEQPVSKPSQREPVSQPRYDPPPSKPAERPNNNPPPPRYDPPPQRNEPPPQRYDPPPSKPSSPPPPPPQKSEPPPQKSEPAPSPKKPVKDSR